MCVVFVLCCVVLYMCCVLFVVVCVWCRKVFAFVSDVLRDVVWFVFCVILCAFFCVKV